LLVCTQSNEGGTYISLVERVRDSAPLAWFCVTPLNRFGTLVMWREKRSHGVCIEMHTAVASRVSGIAERN